MAPSSAPERGDGNDKEERLLEDDGAPTAKVNGTMQTIAGVMGNVLEW